MEQDKKLRFKRNANGSGYTCKDDPEISIERRLDSYGVLFAGIMQADNGGHEEVFSSRTKRDVVLALTRIREKRLAERAARMGVDVQTAEQRDKQRRRRARLRAWDLYEIAKYFYDRRHDDCRCPRCLVMQEIIEEVEGESRD